MGLSPTCLLLFEGHCESVRWTKQSPPSRGGLFRPEKHPISQYQIHLAMAAAGTRAPRGSGKLLSQQGNKLIPDCVLLI